MCDALQINDLESEEDSDGEEGGKKVAEVVGRADRKSTRVRSSTVVYINGDAVLKKNLYDLEEGEPSVFDRELARGQGGCRNGESKEGKRQTALLIETRRSVLMLAYLLFMLCYNIGVWRGSEVGVHMQSV